MIFRIFMRRIEIFAKLWVDRVILLAKDKSGNFQFSAIWMYGGLIFIH